MLLVGACWLNSEPSPIENSRVLISNHSIYYVKSPDTDKVINQISCSLGNRPQTWINFNVKSSSLLLKQSRQFITTSINKYRFVHKTQKMHVYKFTEYFFPLPLTDYLLVYRLDQETNDNFTHQLFDIDQFSGSVTTNPSRIFDSRLVLTHLSQLNLRIDLLVYNTSQSLEQILQIQYEMNIFLQSESSGSSVEKIEAALNGQILVRNVSSLENEMNFITNIQHESDIKLRIEQVWLIFIANASLIEQSVVINNLFYLKPSTAATHETSSLYFITPRVKSSKKIYRLVLSVCQQKFNCKKISFNCKFSFHSPKELTFSSKKLRFNFFSFNQSQFHLFNSNFEQFDFTRPLIDLKKFVHDSESFSSAQSKFSLRKSSKLVSGQLKADSVFYIDESSGLIFSRQAIQFNKVFAFEVDLINTVENVTFSSANVILDITQIPHRLSHMIQFNPNQLEPEVVLIRNLFKHATEANIELSCLSLDQIACKRMFKYHRNQSNLILLVNNFSVKNLLQSSQFELNLKLTNLLSVDLHITVELNDSAPYSYSKVLFVNSTVDLDEFKFDMCTIQSKNLITNKQVTHKNANSEYILHSLELDELYQFDVLSDIPTANRVYLAKYFQQKVYFKYYLNLHEDELLIENKLRINLTSLETNTIIPNTKRIYLINRLNVTASLTKNLNFNYLSKFFRLNAAESVFFFDTDYLSMFLAGDEEVKFDELFEWSELDFVINRFLIDTLLNKIVEIAEFQVSNHKELN